jgi:hypothetical protein
MAKPEQCFVSYAHTDQEGFARLCAHLGPVAHLFGFRLWHDVRIKAGDYWNPRIQAEIERSQIFVLLTTNDMLGSGYIFQHELPAILHQHSSNNALVLPVVYRESCWRQFYGSYIQVLPPQFRGRMRPIMDWPKPERAFAETANAISDAVQDWFGVLPTSPLASLPVKTL